MNCGSAPSVSRICDVNALVFSEAEGKASSTCNFTVDIEALSLVIGNTSSISGECDVDGTIDGYNFAIRTFRPQTSRRSIISTLRIQIDGDTAADCCSARKR